MEKKLYVLKNGEKPGIYIDWLSFFEEIDGMSDVEYKIFTYKTELEDENENVPFSRKWAFKLAKDYLAKKDSEKKLLTDDFERITQEAECELDEELHRTLCLQEELRLGSAWFDMVLYLAGCDNPRVSGGKFTGRYFAPSLYILLLYLVLDTDVVLNEFYERQQLLNQKSMSGLEKEQWYGCVRYELFRAPEFKELQERFLKYDFSKLELNELRHRNRQYVEGSKLLNNRESYQQMQQFVKNGSHTIAELYQELVGNPVYRKELEQVTSTFCNPDLKKAKMYNRLDKNTVLTENVREQKLTSFEQLVSQTRYISEALKKVIIGQDEAIDKFEKAFFHNEKMAGSRRTEGPHSVYLFAGPPGVGKTYMAKTFAKALGRSYRKFDMSTYGSYNSMEEIVGISSFYNNAKAGVLTTYVKDNPRSVLVFDEIEKADVSVTRLFLQILDEGICFDRFYDQNVSFKDCIIIMTTNAGRQLYENVGNENLAELADRVIIDGLEKDIDVKTNHPHFPPEIVSRMASHTIIMFNHLKAEAIRRVIKNDVEKILAENKERYDFDISKGSDVLAATVQYSVGGGGDARNASKLAGKLIDRELYELFSILEEKYGSKRSEKLRQISWECDFTDSTEEIKQFYLGEKDCIVPILKETDREYDMRVSDTLLIKVVNNEDSFMEVVRKENVLFTVIDYVYGRDKTERSMSIADAKTVGQKAFAVLKEENADIPVFLLKNEKVYLYSESEKRTLLRMGAEGFLDEGILVKQVQKAYVDICCKNTMELLTLRHQVLTYATKNEINALGTSAKVIFYNLKLEMAVDAEDRETLISEELRPDKKWEDIYVSQDVKNELKFFIKYLKNPREYMRTGARVPRGALMYGPPGTGKTSLAKVVAAESGINFLSVGADELRNGGIAKVHQVFRVARKYAPAVLFVDEIDAIGMSRNETGSNAVLNALLTEMDGFKRVDTKPVFVMAATNLRGLDAALARRFDRTFMVGLPDEDGRRWMLKRLLQKYEKMFSVSESELESIIIRSKGLSLAELENVMEAALREGIRSGVVVEDALLDEVFEKCNYGEKREKSSEKEIELTAYHEAGHAIVELYYGRVPEYMSIISRADFGGYVQPEKIYEHPTKELLLQKICMGLGGRAAELSFGYGLTPGASSDLQTITNLAIKMVCRYGMYEEEIGLAVISEEEYRKDEKAQRLVNAILKEQLQQAKHIMCEKREAVQRLVQAVLSSEKKYLTKKDILEVYHAD